MFKSYYSSKTYMNYEGNMQYACTSMSQVGIGVYSQNSIFTIFAEKPVYFVQNGNIWGHVTPMTS